MKALRPTTVLIATCLLTATLGCHPGADTDSSAAVEKLEAALEPQEVSLVTPEVREENPRLKLVGEVRSFETIPISTEVVGNIDRVLVEVGDRVAAGDPLVEVDRDTYSLRLAQAEANLNAARAELELANKELARKRDLLSDSTIAQAVFDQAEATQALAEARVGSAEATRDLAQRDLDRSVITAPAAGTIAKRLAVRGQWADINAPLIELAIGAEIKVAARVPEVWMPNLSGLDGFDFSVGASTATYSARLYSIEPVVSQNSRSFEVVGTMKATDSAVRPGMFANVELTAPTLKRSLWLPASAVASADMPEVMLVIDDAIVMRKVQTGRRDNGAIEIVDGIDESQQVVEDVAGLGRGIPVRVVAGGA